MKLDPNIKILLFKAPSYVLLSNQNLNNYIHLIKNIFHSQIPVIRLLSILLPPFIAVYFSDAEILEQCLIESDSFTRTVIPPKCNWDFSVLLWHDMCVWLREKERRESEREREENSPVTSGVHFIYIQGIIATCEQNLYTIFMLLSTLYIIKKGADSTLISVADLLQIYV